MPPRRDRTISVLFICGLFLFRFGAYSDRAFAHEASIRLRIAWGGGAHSTSWEGQISVDRGQLVDPQPLGMEADVPGSMWLEEGACHIARRGPRLYDGVDITAEAPEDAQLIVALTPSGQEQPVVVNIPLSHLQTDSHRAILDDQKNYLLIQRAPGDTIRVQIDRKTMIFHYNETFRFGLEVDLPNIDPKEILELSASLRRARSDQSSWSQNLSLQRADPLSSGLSSPKSWHADMEVPLSVSGGVYNIDLSVNYAKSLAGRLIPKVHEKPLAERRIQLVVLDTKQSARSKPEDWHSVAEIDPTNPHWWNRIPKWMRLEKLPGMPQGPLANGAVTIHTGPIRHRGIELPARAMDQEPAWWAYPLPAETLGAPHLLEIDVPGDTPIDLGISVVEPDAAGRLSPVGRDWGIHRDTDEWSAGSSAMQTYRMIYWPRTEAPLLVITNLHSKMPARFGAIRISSRSDELPRSNTDALVGLSGRQVAGYYDKPLLPETFGATGTLDPLTGLVIDDWQTFYEVATRLTQFSHFAGYNTAVVSVLSDGSALYPSQLLQGGLLYDTGLLASQAQDPFQKDCLELLLNVFDNDGLSLVPALQFNAPLPKLESLCRETEPAIDGLEWIGIDGRTWRETFGMQSGKGPHYNLLNKQVQDAILDIIREIHDRYGRHASLAGIALQLSHETYMQLPGAEWGFDDTTIASFQKETEIEVPGNGPGRFQQRAAFLLGPQRQAWLAWRADRVVQFYQRIREVVAAANSRRMLYLTPARSLDSPMVQMTLGPALPERMTVERSFQELGLDLAAFGKESGPLIMRPYYDGANMNRRQPVDLRINGDIRLDQILKESQQIGVQMFQRSHPVRLPSLAKKNVFGSNTQIASFDFQTGAVGSEARQNLIRALVAHDTLAFFHGGNVFPTTYDPDLRQILELLQRLPHPSRLAATKSNQPVILRIYDEPDATVMCVINDSPWPVDLTVPLQAPAGCEMIAIPNGDRPVTVPNGGHGMHWSLHLESYDIRAVRFSEPSVRAHDIELGLDPAMEKRLAAAINKLEDRAAMMAQSRPFQMLVNPGFETRGQGLTVPGWQLDKATQGVQFELDASNPFEGRYAGRLSSSGPAAVLVSDPFPAPETGRLAIRTRLRARFSNSQPQFRIVVKEIGREMGYMQYTVLGGQAAHALPLPRDWVNYYEFPLQGLPTTHPAQLQVRFELLGEGTVWIDGMELYDLDLLDNPGQNEQLELFKIVNQARNDFSRKRYSDCVHTLEGYWPQFLRRHIPLEDPLDIQQVQDDASPPDPDVADRLKQFVPKFLRR